MGKNVKINVTAKDISDMAVAIKSFPVGDEVSNGVFRLPDDTAKVDHYFAHGVYAREMFIPAGAAVIGKIHNYETLNIMLSGEIELISNGTKKRLKAPQVIVGKAGEQKIGIAIEDVRWLNVHPTKETDLNIIEKEFISETLEDYLTANKLLEG